MKKVVTLIVFVLLINYSAKAIFSYGLTGGVNFCSLGDVEVNFGDYKLFGEPDNYFGFHLGATSKIQLNSLFIQPDLLFSSVGSFLRLEEVLDEPDFDRREYFSAKFYKIDVPVMLGYQFGPIRVFAGPSYSLTFGKTNDYNEGTLEVPFEQSVNTSSLGYQFGAGLGLGNLILDIKYEGGITDFGNTVTIGDITKSFETRPRQVILSIGLLLF